MRPSKAAHHKPRPAGPAPVRVLLHGPMLEAVRAAHPVARDWTDSQVAAACVAMVLKGGGPPPRSGLVHGE